MSRPVQHGQPPYSDDKNDAFEEDKKNMNNMNYEIITTYYFTGEYNFTTKEKFSLTLTTLQ